MRQALSFRKQKLCGLALLLALILLAGYARAQSAPTLSVPDLGKGSAPLDGPWQFHLGDNPSWADPALDDATGHDGWQQLTANTPWGAQGHRSYAGYAWYRRHLHITTAAGASHDLALGIPGIQDTYEIFWNGSPVATFGKFPPHPSTLWEPAPQTWGLGPIRDGVLAVRVWKAPLDSFDSGLQGGFVAPPILGSPSAIAAIKTASDYRWLHSHQYYFALHTLYALIAILGLLMWLRDRSQRVLLWVSLFSLAPLLQTFLVGLRIPFSYNFALGWLQPAIGLGDISLWFLLLWLLNLHDSPRIVRFTRILTIVSSVAFCLDGLLTLFDWSNPLLTGWAQTADGVLTLVFTVAQVYPIVLVILGARRRLDLPRWLVAGFAFLYQGLFETRIAFQQGSRFTHWNFADKISAPLFTFRDNPFAAVTLAATGLFLAIIYAVFCYSREAMQRQQAIEQELRSAQELQQVLIPEELPSLKGFALTSAYHPASEVGGDFFQIIPLRDGSTLLALGDVSGKGLRAAMTVSLIIGTLRTLAEATSSPAEILFGLNRRLHGRLRGGFTTCLIARLDPDGTCVLANAGHPSPFLNGREIPTPGALPLGITLSNVYEQVSATLRPGDHFVLYTDGLLEARSAGGELFGFDRLAALIDSRPDAARATQAAVHFGQRDDITVLTLTRLAVGEESRTELIAPVLAPA